MRVRKVIKPVVAMRFHMKDLQAWSKLKLRANFLNQLQIRQWLTLCGLPTSQLGRLIALSNRVDGIGGIAFD